MTKKDVHAQADLIKDPLEKALFYLQATNALLSDLAPKPADEEEEEESEDEFMCPECQEWTTADDPCCGVGPGRYSEDSLNEER
jgi:hypothetical protein